MKTLEEEVQVLKSRLSDDQRKGKLLGEELERSLEDELALRNYSRRLEVDLLSVKEHLATTVQQRAAESEERKKCEKFIDTSLRSNLITLKKLETLAYFCDKEVDMTTVSIMEVSPEYLDNLLRDVKRSSSSSNGVYSDFELLEHKQNNVEHQINQYLNNIRYVVGAELSLCSVH